MRAFQHILPILVLSAAGCAVAIEEDGYDPSQESSEQTYELEGVEAKAEPSLPDNPGLDLPELSGQTTELDEGSRPDPDPWMNGTDPVRPDPDPWSPPSGTQSSKSSSGAHD